MPNKRFLDSVGSSVYRAPVRTLYAFESIVAHNRLYMRLGGGIIAWWDLARFINRLDSGEPLTFPFYGARTGKSEKVLAPDGSFNSDQRGWIAGNADALGDGRIQGFDVDPDDPDTLYIAAGPSGGWGIVVMGRVVYQNQTEQASMVVALRGSGRKFAIQSKGGAYDVTNPAQPVKLANTVSFISFAKTKDARRVALISARSRVLSIYDADSLAAGGGPLFSGDRAYVSVTSDGTNFFALGGVGTIDVLQPAGDGYTIVASFPRDPSLTQWLRIHYGDGHLVVTGVDTAWAWRVLRVGADLSLTPVPIDYSATIEQGMNAVDGVVIGNRLVLCGKVVGDVYEIAATTPVPDPPKPPVDPPADPMAGVLTIPGVMRYKDFQPGDTVNAQRFYDAIKGEHYDHAISELVDNHAIRVWWFEYKP